MKKQMLPNYSVLMSVYYKEKPEYFKLSIESMLNQTLKTNEFVIVKDGPLTKELDDVIKKFEKKYPNLFKIVELKENVGLGPALNAGVLACTNEFIARMDSDDYSMPKRCEEEMKFLIEHPECSLVGSWSLEFIDDITNIVATRKMPESHSKIVEYSKKRNPYCHPSVVFRKSGVLKAGNYRSYHLVEDYDMWVRMINSGSICYNLQEPLIYFRTSNDFYKRRGGFKYLKSILKFKKELYITKHSNLKDFIISGGSSTIVCLFPGFLRKLVYEKFLRK